MPTSPRARASIAATCCAIASTCGISRWAFVLHCRNFWCSVFQQHGATRAPQLHVRLRNRFSLNGHHGHCMVPPPPPPGSARGGVAPGGGRAPVSIDTTNHRSSLASVVPVGSAAWGTSDISGSSPTTSASTPASDPTGEKHLTQRPVAAQTTQLEQMSAQQQIPTLRSQTHLVVRPGLCRQFWQIFLELLLSFHFGGGLCGPANLSHGCRP